MNKESLEELIKSNFSSLTPKLRAAARYVLDAPKEVALLSMRSLSSNAGLQPASMLRLARVLGFENYEAFRAVYTEWLSNQDSTFLKRAASLRRRSRPDDANPLLAEAFNTEIANLDQTFGNQNASAFRSAEELLGQARSIYILGLRSLFPAAYYFHYVCGMFRGNTTLLTGVGGTIVDELRRIGDADVLLAFSLAPYAATAVKACDYARDRGAKVVAVTDSTVSPIAVGAHAILLAPNASPSLVPSILPAIAVAQMLANLMVAQGKEEMLEEISNSEAQLERFSVYVTQ